MNCERAILHYLSKAFAPDYLSNWVLAAIAFVTAIVAIWTLLSIKEQVKSGRDAAEAARLNAQAVINIERPWIDVRVTKEFIGPTEQFEVGNEYFSISLENRGRTAAEITAHSFIPEIFVVAHDSEMPVRPDDSYTVKRTTPWIIVAGGHSEAQGFSFTSVEIEDRCQKQFGRGPTDNDRIYVFGTVRYRDLIADAKTADRETHWCYLCSYRPNGQSYVIRSGPEGYNSFS